MADCLILAACCTGRDSAPNFSGWTNSDLTGLTEQVDDSTALGSNGGIGVASGVFPTAGTYGATDVTYSVASRKGLISLAVEPASSGTTQAVGIASETDTTLALVRVKSRAVGQPSETNTSQAFTRLKGKPIGQCSQTESSNPVGWAPKRRLVQLASETDLGQAVGRRKFRAAMMVTETSLAQAVGRLKAKLIGQGTETGTSQTIVREGALSATISQSAETDTAQQPIVRLKRITVARGLEVDVAQALERLKVQADALALSDVVSTVGLRVDANAADGLRVALAALDDDLAAITTADGDRVAAAVAADDLTGAAAADAALTAAAVIDKIADIEGDDDEL